MSLALDILQVLDRGRRERSGGGKERCERAEGWKLIYNCFPFFCRVDPITKKWLKASVDPVFGYPSIIRFSWKTCTVLLDANAVQVTW
jgi:hypothetical protein